MLRTSPSNKIFRATRLAMFRLYYLGGAEYQLARRRMGISELTWADWAEEIRGRAGREMMRAGMFPPSKYFREATERLPGETGLAMEAQQGAMRSAEFVSGVFVE
jgi:hypothetical protein